MGAWNSRPKNMGERLHEEATSIITYVCIHRINKNGGWVLTRRWVLTRDTTTHVVLQCEHHTYLDPSGFIIIKVTNVKGISRVDFSTGRQQWRPELERTERRRVRMDGWVDGGKGREGREGTKEGFREGREGGREGGREEGGKREGCREGRV